MHASEIFQVHVRMADEAYCVGTSLSKDSYLNIDTIVKAIKVSGAQAVHPGYGFLAENHKFAEFLKKHNITFIGPKASAILALGDKIESKIFAKKVGVRTIPGYDVEVTDVDHCIEISEKIGFPVMIKASAGGGGKGMRIAWNKDEVRERYCLSKQEAHASFGNDRMLVEKFVANSRHIEFQVLGDSHGNYIYLNERECSIQRRHQKVIGEAPSTFLDPETREAMGNQAVALAKAIGYNSVGTVEFLVDSKKNFYFMEMNASLQVEHSITEWITGVDLVHQMIRVAKGHPLKLRQKDIGMYGWSVESRVYAEDPYKNFGLPSKGWLTKYQEPVGIPKVRCDSAITEGSEISIYYDPMISKLTSWGEDRSQALARMRAALESYVIQGVTHNIPLLMDIMCEPNFISGNIDTEYLPKIYPDGFLGRHLNDLDRLHLDAITSSLYVYSKVKGSMLKESTHKLVLHHDEHIIPIVVTTNSCNEHTVQVGEEKVTIRGVFTISSPLVNIFVGDNSHIIQPISLSPEGCITLSFEGTKYQLNIYEEEVHNFLKFMLEKPKVDVSKILMAPMPGLIKSVSCMPGDSVSQGQELIIIEAMKMLNSLTAPGTGKVKAVNIKVSDTVEECQILVELE